MARKILPNNYFESLACEKNRFQRQFLHAHKGSAALLPNLSPGGDKRGFLAATDYELSKKYGSLYVVGVDGDLWDAFGDLDKRSGRNGSVAGKIAREIMLTESVSIGLLKQTNISVERTSSDYYAPEPMLGD